MATPVICFCQEICNNQRMKQKRVIILSKLFDEQIKKKIDTENLNISVKELLNKFSDYEMTESGKYLEWMTKTYINNGFLYEDLYKVKETLEIFHDNKMKLSKDKRDIQQYKTLSDLWIEVKKFVEQKDDFLSTNEQKRKEKELAYSETEFLYEDDNLRVVAPLTETASKWWGKGTRWCTAAENNNMFMDYFRTAPLLIFDFKDGEKWQLWMNNYSIQFMNEDDKILEKNKIRKKWNYIDFIFKKILEFNNIFFKIIPNEFLDEEFYKNYIKSSRENLLCVVPEYLRTKELCELAVKNNSLALNFVPEKLITPELCKIAVEENGLALKAVPEKFINQKLCEIAVKNNGLALEYIPKHLKTEKIYKLAISQDGEILYHVPQNIITKEICKLSVQKKGFSLVYVPERLKTKEICEMAVKNNGLSIGYVPLNLRTKELCEIAIKNDSYAIEYVPKKFKTEEFLNKVKEYRKLEQHNIENIANKNQNKNEIDNDLEIYKAKFSELKKDNEIKNKC